MKKGLLLLITCLFISAGVNAQLVTGISLITPPDTLFVGNEITLKATILPVNAANKTLTWTTSDATKIQIVSSSDTICKIKSVATVKGNVTITGTASDGSGITVTHTIFTDFPPVSGVSLDKNKISITKDETYNLVATVKPALAVNKNITWESLDNTIATVFNDGKVLGKKFGTTQIIVTTEENGYKDTCVVTVEDRIVDVTDVALDKDTVTLSVGNTVRLTATVIPDVASNKKVTWNSNDTEIAVVSSEGIVTAQKAGETYILVTTEDGGFKDSCIVKVEESLISIDTTVAYTKEAILSFLLDVPKEKSFTGSFTIQFPAGITLDTVNTLLTDQELPSRSLNFTKAANNQWKIDFTSRSIDDKVMDIAYTIDKTVTNGTYNVVFTNIKIKLNDNTEINQDLLTTPIKIDIVTGNEILEGQSVNVYSNNNSLYINSEKAENIYVYSINGKLLKAQSKAEGEAVFDMNTTETILIVKGSTGWVKKIAK